MSWQGMVTGIVFGLIADCILLASEYRSAKMSVIAYACFSLWLMGMMFPLFFMKESYIAALRPTYGNEYADTLNAITPTWAYFVLAGLSFVGGLAGGIMGRVTLRKHFSRAGLA
jgi:energy-coupling factor transport system substrate-specific component